MANEKRFFDGEYKFIERHFNKRLIDANLLKAEFTGNFHEMWHYTGIRAMIDVQPQVDAVEVVRCKDCKHWHEETGWCTKHSHFIGFDGMACHPSQSSEWKMLNAYDFCSYGERREVE